MTRARAYCFTSFDVSDDYQKLLTTLPCKYLVYGRELSPSTGKPHLQGYIYFENARSFESTCKLLGNAHVESSKGSSQENRDYCTKDKDFVEMGTLPHPGARSDLHTIANHCVSGAATVTEVMYMCPSTFMRNYRAIPVMISLAEPKRKWITKVYSLEGVTGSGKSTAAIEAGAVDLTYCKNGDFIEGYDGEDVVLFDETNLEQIPRTLLLRLMGPHRMLIMTKGGRRNWKPRTIFFTTNDVEINDRIISNDEAIARRITFRGSVEEYNKYIIQ
ncbi:MAG: putative viral replication protein [Cressdnaviricota sp.]|nr:MAG: putative viral replication protein [Cressdnaviricota sp.]